MISPVINKNSKGCAETLGISAARATAIEKIFKAYCDKLDEKQFPSIPVMMDTFIKEELADYSEVILAFYLLGGELQMRAPMRLVIDIPGGARSGEQTITHEPPDETKKWN